ncbi:MAG: glucose-1-phosphate adenylyltransferase [Methylococcaceae bacterium]
MRNDNLTIILAGGVGSRLEPLTNDRTKPAVPFGGKYRIIDFSLANCLHSGLRRILVLTQYKSYSLHKHLRDGWSIFNPELGEYVTAVPPQMRTGNYWYRGTADAIYQNLYLVKRSGVKTVLILSGDHIYRMDYAAMLKIHHAKQAEMTIATMAVPVAEASDFGVLSIDENCRVNTFQEKPLAPETLPDDSMHALVSMGIYVFSVDLLIQTLEADAENESSHHDFGKDIIPNLIDRHAVYAYQFGTRQGRVSQDCYWRDVGNVDSYYQANMDLLKLVPPLNLFQSNWPIRSYQAQNPPMRAVPGASGGEGVFVNSTAAAGVVIEGGNVHFSILFARVVIADKAMINNAILFDGVSVGVGAQLQNCIVDKNVEIPAGESVGFNIEKDRARFTISEKGIVVIPKNYSFK